MSSAAIGWTAGGLGLYLIYAAIADKNPVAQLTATLSGDPSAARPIGKLPTYRPVTVADGSPGGGAGGYGPVATATPAQQSAALAIATGPSPPANLTAIGGGHRLAPPAAAAYNAASAAFGRPIPITDSYRSLAVQTSAYASDPERFAPPTRSLHPKGLAIDVNGKAVRLDDPALLAALRGAGWAQTALPKEPWHWSFGVRG